jgi:tetratricopeptide (TPR) repeat protein
MGSYRSDERDASPFLRACGEIQKQRGMEIRERELAVEPLDRAESSRLVLELLGRDDQEAKQIAETISQESGGNPFIVSESVKYVQSTTHVDPDEPITLQNVLKGRLTRSSDEERRLLEVVAVGAQPMPPDVAFCAAETVEAGPRVLAQLTADHLIRTIGPTDETEIEMYHDRIRESLVAVLPEETVCELHHRIATALEDTGQADPESLAVHYHGAKQHAEAAKYYGIAADQAADALAFDRAVELYRFALELRRDETATDADLRTRLGDALANAGRGEEAAREYLEVAETSLPARQSELRLLAAMQYLLAGHIDDGLTALEAPLAAEGLSLPKTSVRALGSILSRRMQLRLRGLRYDQHRPSDSSKAALHRIDTCWSVARAFSVVDTIRGADFELRSLLLAFRIGDPLRIARALSLEAAHVASGGRSASKRTAQLLEVAQHLAQQVSDPYATAFVLLCSGGAAYLVDGRWKEALDLCDQAEVVFRERCTGVAWEMDTTHTFALWSLTYMGQITEVRRRRQVLLKEAQERGDLYAQTNLGTYIMALDRLGVDDREGAKKELQDAMSRWTQRGFHVQHHNATLAHTLVELYCGNGLGAWQRIREVFPAYRRSFLLRVQQVRIDILQSRARSVLAAACTDTDNRTSLLRAASSDARRLKREKVPWATASSELISGMVAWARGDETNAAAMLEAAAANFDAADMELHAAAARSRLGQLVGGSRGDDLMEQASSRMEAQQIRDQSRFTWMMAPGVSEPEPSS